MTERQMTDALTIKDDIQEKMKTQIIHRVRVKQREISERIKALQQKFAKL